MNASKLAVDIAKIEGKKKSVNIAQIKEILAILSDKMAVDDSIAKCLVANGRRRLNRGN